MAKIDMTGNGKKVTIRATKPLEGIEFSKRVEPSWVKKSSELSKLIVQAQRHAEYCQSRVDESRQKYETANDSMKKMKLKQDIEYWNGQLTEARKGIANISRSFANFHKSR